MTTVQGRWRAPLVENEESPKGKLDAGPPKAGVMTGVVIGIAMTFFFSTNHDPYISRISVVVSNEEVAITKDPQQRIQCSARIFLNDKMQVTSLKYRIQQHDFTPCIMQEWTMQWNINNINVITNGFRSCHTCRKKKCPKSPKSHLLSFQEQLKYIVQTDFFLAVHGAGNIHAIFLPDHPTVYEYFPEVFKDRKRFRFLLDCLNLTYVAKKEWVVLSPFESIPESVMRQDKTRRMGV